MGVSGIKIIEQTACHELNISSEALCMVNFLAEGVFHKV